MSVLIHDKNRNKYFCFSKGAPEKMVKYAKNSINNYDAFVAHLALMGLRTIAFSFR